jgi:hypothetical protein
VDEANVSGLVSLGGRNDVYSEFLCDLVISNKARKDTKRALEAALRSHWKDDRKASWQRVTTRIFGH